MIVKVSNPMTKYIQTAFRGMASARLEKMTPDEYGRFVDYDLFSHTDDYDGTRFKVIKVMYPCSDYAMPAYITTRDLVKAFRESDKTADGFADTLRRQYAI